jgi:hypothetical protein
LQAWSLQYRHALSPYSYIYDHAPAGWIQLSLWSMLTSGFNRYDSAIGFGNECMLIAKLASCALLFALGRRLQFSRVGAAAAVLLFGLCPLELMYSRWTFLDNLVTPWLLLAFVLAASPRHPDRPAGPPAPAGGPRARHPVAGPGPWRLCALHARGQPDARECAGGRGGCRDPEWGTIVRIGAGLPPMAAAGRTEVSTAAR